MSLSDSCFDSLHELGVEIRHYSDWGYDAEHLSGVIDAMFSLAEVAVELNQRGFPDFDENLAVNRTELISLLPDPNVVDEDELEAVVSALARVRAVDARFRKALRDVRAWANSSEGRDIVAEDCPEFSVADAILRYKLPASTLQ